MTKLKDIYITHADMDTQQLATLSALKCAAELYIDLEIYGKNGVSALDTLACTIRLVTICDAQGNVLIFDFLTLDEENKQELFSLLNNKTLIGHNLLFDLQILVRYGLEYPVKVRDTLLGSQVLTAGLDYKHSMGECVTRYLKKEIVKDQGGSDWGAKNLSERQLEYARDDVLILIELDATIRRLLAERKLLSTYEMECNILCPITSMSLTGVGVDVELWTARSHEAEKRAAVSETKLDELFGLPPEQPFKTVRYTKKDEPNKVDLKSNERIAKENAMRRWNYGSPIQITECFKNVGFVLEDTKYETLTRYVGQHDSFDLFLSFREDQKEATTFGMEWLSNVRNGRVHPKWWQMGAASGRMSCSSPNMQQLPRGACRKGIAAKDGHVFVRSDFSQIEARIACKIADEQVMLRLFRDPTGDIHAYTASKVLQKENVTKEDRQTGKSLVFGLLFGMSAKSLREYCRVNYRVSLSEGEATLFRDRFFQTYPGLQKWHAAMHKKAQYATECHTLLGRRRILDPNIISNPFGFLVNTPVQGSAGDMLKLSVSRLWDDRRRFPDARLVMLIHDEIVYEVPEEQSPEVATWLHDTMVNVGNELIAPVPVEASVKIGKTWGG